VQRRPFFSDVQLEYPRSGGNFGSLLAAEAARARGTMRLGQDHILKAPGHDPRRGFLAKIRKSHTSGV
jgi:hypothetical protein